MINYFDVLNVSENAEPEVIRASYKALAKKYHPDSYKGTKEVADKKMLLINEAYSVLSDDYARKEYLIKLRRYERGQFSNNSKTSDDLNDSFRKQSTEVSNDNMKDACAPKHIGLGTKLFWLVIFFVVGVCIYRYGPAYVSDLWSDFVEKIQDFIYTFS
jgi:curved DNA-binding protein CbpA